MDDPKRAIGEFHTNHLDPVAALVHAEDENRLIRTFWWNGCTYEDESGAGHNESDLLTDTRCLRAPAVHVILA